MTRTLTDETGQRKRPHLMYEHRTAPLLPWPAFVRRVVRHGGYAGALVAGSMLAGTAGFIGFARQEPIDALLNTAMLLGGMGPWGRSVRPAASCSRPRTRCTPGSCSSAPAQSSLRQCCIGCCIAFICRTVPARRGMENNDARV